jgi:hypothetical protein
MMSTHGLLPLVNAAALIGGPCADANPLARSGRRLAVVMTSEHHGYPQEVVLRQQRPPPQSSLT